MALDLPAGETAARRRWSEFLADGLASYAGDRDRPDRPGTSRMSAHLFGTIHPRTLAADLDIRDGGAAACASWLSGTSTPRCCISGPASAWRNWNTAFDTIEVDTGAGGPGCLRGVEARSHRVPDRRCRDAPVARQRIHAQPGPDDRGVISGEGSAPALAVGARWFLEQLVDADVASNQHGWQWCGGRAPTRPRISGCSTPPHRARSSTRRVTTRRWVPELADTPDVHRLKADGLRLPEPIVDHAAERASTAAVRADRLRCVPEM